MSTSTSRLLNAASQHPADEVSGEVAASASANVIGDVRDFDKLPFTLGEGCRFGGDFILGEEVAILDIVKDFAQERFPDFLQTLFHDFLLGFRINFKVDFNVDVEVVS